MKLSASSYKSIRSRLRGKVLILGLGNTLRSDDGAGSILAKRLKDNPYFTVIDADAVPENYLTKIIRIHPDTIIIIDSADLGKSPGTIEVLESKDLVTVNLFSTHNASLSLTINYLQNNLEADIIILLIQPESIKFGEVLSVQVRESIEDLEGFFNGR